MWDQTCRSRRRDRQKLFVVNYADGSRAFLRVPHEIAAVGVSPPVMKLVREVQARGEIPAGALRASSPRGEGRVATRYAGKNESGVEGSASSILPVITGWTRK